MMIMRRRMVVKVLLRLSTRSVREARRSKREPWWRRSLRRGQALQGRLQGEHPWEGQLQAGELRGGGFPKCSLTSNTLVRPSPSLWGLSMSQGGEFPRSKMSKGCVRRLRRGDGRRFPMWPNYVMTNRWPMLAKCRPCVTNKPFATFSQQINLWALILHVPLKYCYTTISTLCQE